MKTRFSIIIITAALIVSIVACNSKPVANQVSYQDTVGFAQFKAWKAMQEQAYINELLANNTTTSANRSVRRSGNTNSGTMNSTSTHTANVSKKKGWSNAAKYSVIGGVGGGVLGAIINKRNRVAGGVIGGIIGGGGGYIIGRSKDKREGRY